MNWSIFAGPKIDLVAADNCLLRIAFAPLRKFYAFAHSHDFHNLLDDPLNAIVVLILRTHGPVAPGFVQDQIRTFNGGCNIGEPNEGLCQDRQGSVLLP